jgi:hypothetical protein
MVVIAKHASNLLNPNGLQVQLQKLTLDHPDPWVTIRAISGLRQLVTMVSPSVSDCSLKSVNTASLRPF